VKRADLLLFAAALALSFALKRHAAHANADDLGWLLEPTAWLVTAASGHEFVFERGAGPFNRELALVLAPSCAGVNYAIVAFLALIAGFLPRLGSSRQKLSYALAAALVAYVATLCVNATRVLVSIELAKSAWLASAVSREALHRVEGVVVYLGSLLLLCLAVDRALFRRVLVSSRSLLALPLGLYLAVTLLVPALNGALAGPRFASHAVAVTAFSVALWLCTGALLRHFCRQTAEQRS